MEILELTKHKNRACFKVIVDNIKDYSKLKNKNNWPNNAFIEGVEVEEMSANLLINISGVDKTINIEREGELVDEVCRRYGLSNFERITINDDLSSRCRASVDTIAQYIQTSRGGIFIGKKKHKVYPNIYHARACNKCGSLNHSSYNCKMKPRCITCSDFTHISLSCVA